MLQIWWAVPSPNEKLNLTISFCSDRSIEKHEESSLYHEQTGTFISNIYRNIHPFFSHKKCKPILGPRQILKEKNPTDEFDDSIIVSMQTQLNKKYTQFVEMTASEENQVIVIPDTQSTLNSETPSLEVGKVIVLGEYETAATRTGKKAKNIITRSPTETEKATNIEIIDSDSDGPVDPIELPSESKRNKVHDGSDVIAENSAGDFDCDFEADSALDFTPTSTPCLKKSSESHGNDLGCLNCETLNTKIAEYEKFFASYSLKFMKQEIEISNAQREIQKLKTEIQQNSST